jgi:hypothetical protein
MEPAKPEIQSISGTLTLSDMDINFSEANCWSILWQHVKVVSKNLKASDWAILYQR